MTGSMGRLGPACSAMNRAMSLPCGPRLLLQISVWAQRRVPRRNPSASSEGIRRQPNYALDIFRSGGQRDVGANRDVASDVLGVLDRDGAAERDEVDLTRRSP